MPLSTEEKYKILVKEIKKKQQQYEDEINITRDNELWRLSLQHTLNTIHFLVDVIDVLDGTDEIKKGLK